VTAFLDRDDDIEGLFVIDWPLHIEILDLIMVMEIDTLFSPLD
jgi:hypothetical protein